MKLKYLLLSMPCALYFMPYTSMAGLRVGNLSRSNAAAYQQVNEMRNTAMNTANPIPTNGATAQAAETVSDEMQQCPMIYPGGEFVWARPTVGRGVGGAATCTAVVEMRAVGAGLNGSDAVVARANLAAGDSVLCNISHFPKATYLPAAGDFEFPADTEPTPEDVVAVLNAEQKQNAGLKIAAATILGGLSGNIAGKNEPGNDGLLGGGKSKTSGTIIGALGGAALMTGSVYGGKVAGDMILSAGVNAAAGAVVGNISPGGDSVLRIEPCTVDGRQVKCLWGYIEEYETATDKTTAYVSKNNPKRFMVCSPTENKAGAESEEKCEYKNLNTTGATIKGCDFYEPKRSDKGDIDLEDIFASDKFECANAESKHCYKEGKMEELMSDYCEDSADIWIKLEGDIAIISSKKAAMVVDVKDKPLGWKKSEWSKFVESFGSNEVVGRTGKGTATYLDVDFLNNSTGDKKDNKQILLQDVEDFFSPDDQDSDEGSFIELGNKARMKGTLTGAGVGGTLGAFSAYQGAQREIEARWVSAVQEYKDSLQKVYCVTGTRFLSQYNDAVIIPSIGTE
ncbi:MAG: hypothetical protein R8M70_02430 [Alphaproteobacteria bacterium]|nr:hypothetical protein [Alphaproteobacteria bacterium]